MNSKKDGDGLPIFIFFLAIAQGGNMEVSSQMDQVGSRQKWGPIHLLQGVKPANMTVYVIGAMFAMLFSTFVPQAQPFILTEILHIPQSQQGVLSGYLGLAATLVGLIVPGIWGTLSDKTGRRIVYALGLLISAVGIAIFPLASSLIGIYLCRSLFSAGSNASQTMSTALLADYVENKDRGKAYGMVAAGSGVGALLTVFLFLRLPSIFMNSGLSAQVAARYTYWIVALIGVIAMGVILTGLMGKTSRQVEEKRSVIQIAKDAIKAAQKDPSISLAYGVNFTATGAINVIGTFFTLWIVTYGTTTGRLTSAEALARAGMIMGITQMMGLVSAPLFGILADRIPRVLAVVLACGLTAVAYAATLLISNPLSIMMIILGIFLGLVQISGVITAGALIAQQTPDSVRGSVMGFYGFCAALGTMLASVLGGFLFDRWIPQGPFVLSAVLSLAIVVWGLAVYTKKKKGGVK
jgi:MFS family permease